MFKIKFGLLPGHWGLAGKTREIAQAEYELEGYELEERLLNIKTADFSTDEMTRKYADLELRYNKITQAKYQRILATLIRDEKQRALANLELDQREGKLTEIEYAKQSATMSGEPWVTVISMDFGNKSALEGSFELDWNEQFVEKLRAEGYAGITDDVIVNSWFMEVCRNVAMEEFDGTGDFTADSEANLDAVKRWSADANPLANGRKGYK